MRLILNGEQFGVASASDAQTHWDKVRNQQFSDVWLEPDEQGPVLYMLVNGERAWLLYLRDHDGDPGFSSRDPAYVGPPDALMEFRLTNGQGDEYPAAWTLPLSDCIAACDYFISSQGRRSMQITWHDDSAEA